MPDLRAVLLLNGFGEGLQLVADVSLPSFDFATMFGVEMYQIRASSFGPEGFVATTDTDKMPRKPR